jgi:hypothetical protein
MMTHTNTIAAKIVKPIVLAALMIFSTPIFGLIYAKKTVPTPIVSVSNETVVFKANNASVAFKS